IPCLRDRNPLRASSASLCITKILEEDYGPLNPPPCFLKEKLREGGASQKWFGKEGGHVVHANQKARFRWIVREILGRSISSPVCRSPACPDEALSGVGVAG